MKKQNSVFFFIFLSIAASAQVSKVTLSGWIKDKREGKELPYVNVIIKTEKDSVFVAGTVSNDQGQFALSGVAPGNYLLTIFYVGYVPKLQPLRVGKLSEYLDIGILELEEKITSLQEIVVRGEQHAVAEALDKKIFNTSDNINQRGGSLLQMLQNLPGITMSDDGKVKLRGNDRVSVLIDGKQTALTGFGNQTSLDNIPASAIERIEVVNHPSARYDANGNAGIINIIYKKEVREGMNGKIGITTGVGAIWIKRKNYPDIRPQYQATPKVNPSFSINYRKKRMNFFFQGDNLYTRTLNKNEFVDRYYDNGDTVRQQIKRNRTTNVVTGKTGFDWYVDKNNTFTLSGLFSSEKILDRGDEPFFNGSLSERQRVWQFLEDELKTTVTSSAVWQHRFTQPGRSLNINLNYTFHRENENYFFTNILPTFTGFDSFKLLSDEHVGDLNVDYVQPLKYGRFETGLKIRKRSIPTNMKFHPGLNSPLDSTAGGWADYSETIPAIYGNYVYENKYIELEAGLRVEYVDLYYRVNPDHPTYKSDGYNYTQPFPSLRFAYKADDSNTWSLFYTRRVDRPNEVDIRIFPKYDDAEIIKVGNPGLQPQFTTTIELGYKNSWNSGYLYTAFYHKQMEATITRIASTVPGSNLIYNIFQNAGNSHFTGAEILLSKSLGKWATATLDLNGYQNVIEAFSVTNNYPVQNTVVVQREKLWSGNIKLNALLHLPAKWDVQLTSVCQAPDLIPQGKTFSRFYIDIGLKKSIQQGKGELFINATDIANTLRIKRQTIGNDFHLVSTDYYETQVIRTGYNYKF